MKFLVADIETSEVLDKYEQEMRKEVKQELLTWHLIVLQNFVDNFLPTIGVELVRINTDSHR